MRAQFGTAARTENHLPPIRRDLFERLEHGIDRIGSDQRTHQGFLIERISNPHLAISLNQLSAQLSGDALMNNNPTRRSTALTRCAHGTEKNRARCQIKIGFLGYDDRIIPAKFQNRSTEPAGDGLRHMPTD